jgi:hypothetical protein
MLLNNRQYTYKLYSLSTESLAEHTKRPLYVVGCAKLGVDVDRLAERLLGVMRRAVIWNAILLIDEADVFLE